MAGVELRRGISTFGSKIGMITYRFQIDGDCRISMPRLRSATKYALSILGIQKHK